MISIRLFILSLSKVLEKMFRGPLFQKGKFVGESLQKVVSRLMNWRKAICIVG